MSRTRVLVDATDALTRAGLVGALSDRPGLLVLADTAAFEAPEVAVLAEDCATGATAGEMWGRTPDVPVVLVADRVTDLPRLAARRVVALLGRGCPACELADRVLAAAALTTAAPNEVLAQLRRQVTAAAEVGRPPAELTTREIAVLRLMADGWRTPDIAGELCYSERTIKNIVYAVIDRLNLRNREHAVAYAVRAGLI